MSPAVFRTAVRYRLGVIVARPDVVCSFCMQSFDEYGDHAACCRMNGDLIVRHNRLRNLLCRIAEEGLLSPVLEKKGILRGESSGRRPGDVTVPCWKNSKGLAIDVAVTSPFSKTNLRLESPADVYGLKNTRSTTKALWALTTSSAQSFSRPQGESATRAYRFSDSSSGYNRTQSCASTRVAAGPGSRATFRLLLHRPFFTECPRAATHSSGQRSGNHRNPAVRSCGKMPRAVRKRNCLLLFFFFPLSSHSHSDTPLGPTLPL
jgi:hypothetical protein